MLRPKNGVNIVAPADQSVEPGTEIAAGGPGNAMLKPPPNSNA
jgi:hypothetical protein